MMGNLSKPVRDQIHELVSIRRDIHMHPEPGFKEKRTSGIIENYLRKAGVKARRVCGTGMIGLVEGARPGKTILFRADIDGLPVTELNDVPYKSKNPGFMHACGHDAHVATALVAARLLQQMRRDLKGTVKFMFQPAEEGPGGAVPMMKAGVLGDPNVDYAFALHVWNDLPAGKFGIRVGPVMAGAGSFRAKIVGRGGHGAQPEQTVDPVVVAAHVVTQLQTIVSRKLSPVKPGVVTVGKIEGGTRFNVIPDSVTLEGTYRWFHSENLRAIKSEIGRVLKGVTAAHGAKFELSFEMDEYPPTVNDPDATRAVREAATEVVGGDNVVEQQQTMGAEDMAFVLQKVPGCYWMLGTANRSRGLDHPHHSAKFDIDEAALPAGVETWVRLAKRLLS